MVPAPGESRARAMPLARVRRLLSEIHSLRVRQLNGEVLTMAQLQKIRREGGLRSALADRTAASAMRDGGWSVWVCGNPLCTATNDTSHTVCRAPRCRRPGPPHMDARFQVGWRQLAAKRWARAARIIQRAWRRRMRQRTAAAAVLQLAVARWRGERWGRQYSSRQRRIRTVPRDPGTMERRRGPDHLQCPARTPAGLPERGPGQASPPDPEPPLLITLLVAPLDCPPDCSS